MKKEPRPIKIKIKDPIVPPKNKGQFQKIHQKPTNQIMQLYGMLRYSLKETALCLGMSYNRLNEFIKEDESLRESFDAGSLKAISSVSRKAYELAVSGAHPNCTFRWLESNDKERWGKTQVIETKDESTEEVKRLAKLLLDAAKNPTRD